MPGFALLPAAVTMVAGPQIIGAVVLATSRKPRGNSLAYILGVLCAVIAGTGAALLIVEATHVAAHQAGSSDVGRWIDYMVAALLGAVAIHSFTTRKTAKPPKWLTTLQDAEPHGALKVGFVLFLVMPTDVAMMVSAAAYLAKNELGLVHALPFLLLTLLLISLPLIAYLLLGERAEKALPGVRDWMDRYSWAINVGICAYFIVQILT